MQKTIQLFDLWNQQAKNLEFFFVSKHSASVGEVRRYYEGINIGNEISKDGGFQRPCIILKNNLGNGLYMIIPLTTKFHSRMKKYYYHISHPERFGIIGGFAILNQVTLIDKKRLSNKLSQKLLSKEMISSILQSYYSL